MFNKVCSLTIILICWCIWDEEVPEEEKEKEYQIIQIRNMTKRKKDEQIKKFEGRMTKKN